MIPLDLDNPLLDGTATAAPLLQFCGQGNKGGTIKGQAADKRHPFTLAALGFPPDLNAALCRYRIFFLSTQAGGHRLAALRAETAVVG